MKYKRRQAEEHYDRVAKLLNGARQPPMEGTQETSLDHGTMRIPLEMFLSIAVPAYPHLVLLQEISKMVVLKASYSPQV